MTALEGPAQSPELPTGITAGQDEYAKLRYNEELEAWLETWKQQVSTDAVAAALKASREDTDRAAETVSVKSIQDAYIAVTQSSLDRSLTRVNVVTTSVSAIITVYTGLLALVYAAKPGNGKVLTPVAVIPALFLGLALLLITVYAALFRGSLKMGTLLPTGMGGQIAEIRLITFMRWCFAGVLARTWALHAGIVSLGFGVATLPMPFINLKGVQQIIILGVGLLAVLIAGAVAKCRSGG
jgi:hypothetical protein